MAQFGEPSPTSIVSRTNNNMNQENSSALINKVSQLTPQTACISSRSMNSFNQNLQHKNNQNSSNLARQISPSINANSSLLQFQQNALNPSSLFKQTPQLRQTEIQSKSITQAQQLNNDNCSPPATESFQRSTSPNFSTFSKNLPNLQNLQSQSAIQLKQQNQPLSSKVALELQATKSKLKQVKIDNKKLGAIVKETERVFQQKLQKLQSERDSLTTFVQQIWPIVKKLKQEDPSTLISEIIEGQTKSNQNNNSPEQLYQDTEGKNHSECPYNVTSQDNSMEMTQLELQLTQQVDTLKAQNKLLTQDLAAERQKNTEKEKDNENLIERVDELTAFYNTVCKTNQIQKQARNHRGDWQGRQVPTYQRALQIPDDPAMESSDDLSQSSSETNKSKESLIDLNLNRQPMNRSMRQQNQLLLQTSSLNKYHAPAQTSKSLQYSDLLLCEQKASQDKSSSLQLSQRSLSKKPPIQQILTKESSRSQSALQISQPQHRLSQQHSLILSSSYN